MLFVDWHILSGAVYFRGRSVYETTYFMIPGRLKKIQGSGDIGADVALGGLVRIRDGNQRGQMQDAVRAPGCRLHAEGIPDVGGEKLKRLLNLGRYEVQPAVMAEGVVLHHSPDLVPVANESLNNMRTDKTIGPGHQNGVMHM